MTGQQETVSFVSPHPQCFPGLCLMAVRETKLTVSLGAGHYVQLTEVILKIVKGRSQDET